MVDWRTESGFNFRQGVLNVVVDKLKNRVPSSDDPNVQMELHRLATRFEEKVYHKATSKSDYLFKIHQKLKQTENLYHAKTPTSSSAVEQDIHPNILCGSAPGRQPFHQAVVQLQQHLHSITEPQTDEKSLQQDQKFGWQNFVLQLQQQQPLCPQNMSDAIKQPLLAINNASGLQYQQQLQEMVGFEPHVLNMQQYQQSIGTGGEVISPVLQPTLNWSSSSTLFQPLPKFHKQKNQIQEDSLWALPLSAASLHSQNDSFHSQVPVAKSLSEFTAQNEFTHTSEWQFLVSQFQHIREMYLPELISLYKTSQTLCSEASNVEHLEKYKNERHIIEKMIKSLQIPDSDIIRYPKKTLIHYHNLIVQYMSSFRGRNPFLLGRHSHSTHLQNSISYTSNPTMRSDPAMPIPPLSLWQGVQNSQPSTIRLPQNGALNKSEQNDSQSLLHHGPQQTAQQNIMLKQEQTLMQEPGVKQQMPQAIRQPWTPQMLQQNKNLISNSVLTHMTNDNTGNSQQDYSKGQFSEKFLPTLAQTIPHEGHEICGQTSQNSSLHINQKQDFSCLPKVRTPSQPTVPLSLAVSPSTPLTPSSLPRETGQSAKNLLPNSFPDKRENSETFVAVSANKVQGQTELEGQSVAVDTPGISASYSISNFNDQENNQLLLTSKQPIERLVDMVQSASHEVVITSIYEILTVLSINDLLAETSGVVHPEVAMQEELETITSCSVQVRDFRSKDGCGSTKKIKHIMQSVPLDASAPFHNDGLQLCDSTALARIKRPRIEPSNKLFEEIRKVNCQFVETAIEVVSDSTEHTAVSASEGTVVRCTHTAVVLGERFKRQFSSSQVLPLLSIELLVPSNYPDSSPKILGRSAAIFGKETEDLTQKAKCRFNRSLRSLTEPLSLGDMALVWDNSARAVFSELFRLVGGECFSSGFGAWKRIPAA